MLSAGCRGAGCTAAFPAMFQGKCAGCRVQEHGRDSAAELMMMTLMMMMLMMKMMIGDVDDDDDDDDDDDYDCLIGCMRVSETKPLCRVPRKG